MAFEWNKIHDCEENLRKIITERVIEYVCDYYKVKTINDLTQDQIKEMENWFGKNLHPLNIMQIGFENLIYYWEKEKNE